MNPLTVCSTHDRRQRARAWDLLPEQAVQPALIKAYDVLVKSPEDRKKGAYCALAVVEALRDWAREVFKRRKGSHERSPIE